MKYIWKKVLQELFGTHFLGRPYCANGAKVHLDAALDFMFISCCKAFFLFFYHIIGRQSTDRWTTYMLWIYVLL